MAFSRWKNLEQPSYVFPIFPAPWLFRETSHYPPGHPKQQVLRDSIRMTSGLFDCQLTGCRLGGWNHLPTIGRAGHGWRFRLGENLWRFLVRIIGPSNGRVWTSIGGVQVFRIATATFEGPGFLGLGFFIFRTFPTMGRCRVTFGRGGRLISRGTVTRLFFFRFSEPCSQRFYWVKEMSQIILKTLEFWAHFCQTLLPAVCPVQYYSKWMVIPLFRPCLMVAQCQYTS